MGAMQYGFSYFKKFSHTSTHDIAISNLNSLQTGQTPVHYASWKGHAPVVQLLIDKGADISICDEVIITYMMSLVLHRSCNL